MAIVGPTLVAGYPKALLGPRKKHIIKIYQWTWSREAADADIPYIVSDVVTDEELGGSTSGIMVGMKNTTPGLSRTVLVEPTPVVSMTRPGGLPAPSSAGDGKDLVGVVHLPPWPGSFAAPGAPFNEALSNYQTLTTCGYSTMWIAFEPQASVDSSWIVSLQVSVTE